MQVGKEICLRDVGDFLVGRINLILSHARLKNLKTDVIRKKEVRISKNVIYLQHCWIEVLSGVYLDPKMLSGG